MNATPMTRNTQQGATLFVVLILLLVMTLLALASIRGTLLEERMSSNQYDRSLSFQAAEAALRAGEAVASDRPKPAAGCTAGLCGKPNPAAAPVWESAAVWGGAMKTTVDLGDKTATPEYIVELLADDIPPKGACTTSGDLSEGSCTGNEARYRITARSMAADRAYVMLQSIYAVP